MSERGASAAQRRRQCLEAMGIVRYRLRNASGTGEPAERVAKPAPPAAAREERLVPEEPAVPAQNPPTSPAGRDEPAAGLDWEGLEQAVAGCCACGLCKTRRNTVFGVGNREAELMIIGEAPGAEEDRQGEPFVGRAGELLNNMLAAIGLGRDRVYIANILKCRPPGNRNPSVEEAAACAPFLQRQLELVAPRVVLAVGGVAAHNLLATDESVGRLRSRQHRLPGSDVPVLVTYHPAYLLRRPEEKAKSWVDLQGLHRFLHE